MAFDLESLVGAKSCTKENCKVNDDCAAFCIGCGRSCHLECLKIPEHMVTSLKGIPKSNRARGYFGDLSYIKLVCDNCANLLNCATRPNFLALFNDLAKKQEESEVIVIPDGPRSSQRIAAKKRTVDDLDNEPAYELMAEMKRMVEKCVIKLSNVESITTKSIAKLTDIETTQLSMLTNVKSNGHALLTINGKIDSNVSTIDDGIQKGFNQLTALAEKMNSPFNTPSRGNHNFGFGRASSMRKNAMSNRVRGNYSNGTPTSKQVGGPKLPTEAGAATENESLFGPAVPRKLVFNSIDDQQLQRAPRKEFRHDNAIFIRYIDPSITPDKMMAILSYRRD